MKTFGVVRLGFFSTLSAALTILCSFHHFVCIAGHAAEITFPKDGGVLDVRNFGAKPDDAGNDTAAIQKALDAFPNGNRIIYLPAGTWIVSDTLRWPDGKHGGEAQKRTILQGAGRSVTRLRLPDATAGFADGKTKALIWTGGSPAQRFRNTVRDLNDWIGCLGGHPQTKTPNFDRLAASGVLFKNAYCVGASCNPSRAAILSELTPHRSGLYNNRQKMREVLPDAELMPRYFSRNGYWSAGSGKMLHYVIDPQSWDDYFPDKAKDNPFPRTFYPTKRPVNLPRAGEWQYDETDWAALDVTDEEFGGDWLLTKWIGEQLQRAHDKPFFLACGIYRPHEPWFVPKKYFEPFPLETIQPGPGYKADDLDDIPPAGQKLGRNRYFAHIQKEGQWKKGIQAYLASIHFADAMLGRVLDALEKSPQRDNTIVVLWSDHGWHLGEKEHWQKFTGWRICDRVPLMVRVPKGMAPLPEGTRAGSVCDRPVSLVDLFRTLTDLCGLPDKPDIMGGSLVPLLRDPSMNWPHAAITHLDQPESYAISTERWRYIHYKSGDEELYDIASDPHEWTNLAPKAEHAAKLAEMRTLAPKEVNVLVLPKETKEAPTK